MTKEDTTEVEEAQPPSEFTSPVHEPRKKPMVHPSAQAPLPKDYAFTFFDPNDPACLEILTDPRTTIPELFAIIRQWVPQVQHKIDIIGEEILKRGCHVNDRDGLTDMTLLHYSCKAGAHGVGDPEASLRLTNQLIALGADVSLRSRWTNMNALHYAAYFDVPELIRVLLKASKPRVLNSTCSDFYHGTALHIAASNLCLGAVKCLLEHGANPSVRVQSEIKKKWQRWRLGISVLDDQRNTGCHTPQGGTGLLCHYDHPCQPDCPEGSSSHLCLDAPPPSAQLSLHQHHHPRAKKGKAYCYISAKKQVLNGIDLPAPGHCGVEGVNRYSESYC